MLLSLISTLLIWKGVRKFLKMIISVYAHMIIFRIVEYISWNFDYIYQREKRDSDSYLHEQMYIKNMHFYFAQLRHLSISFNILSQFLWYFGNFLSSSIKLQLKTTKVNWSRRKFNWRRRKASSDNKLFILLSLEVLFAKNIYQRTDLQLPNNWLN